MGAKSQINPKRETPEDEQARAAAVRGMFTSIAHRYDLLNHLLSFNVDKLWWRRTARAFAPLLARPGVRVLDLCCGTGDMTFALLRQAARSGNAKPSICGVDFSPEMLRRARAKSGARTPGAREAISWIEADALHLPFPDGGFQVVTCAFGFRNLVNYEAGLREIHRVLAPGGEAGILDFGEPDGVLGKLYRVYFRHVLPAVGALVSGVRGPYSYLPASVSRFPPPDQMLARLRACGFRQTSRTSYTFGIAGLYRGMK
jgi:demethylmenaquinone methyltransferase/2-methoxy-6-polyprenyl-1,4-benzoquinol methylase